MTRHGRSTGILPAVQTDQVVRILGWAVTEPAIRIHVQELPEGLFLATSDEMPGLVAQGRTVSEALEIARDVARKLIEARRERGAAPTPSDGGAPLP